jgi:hypothetical protein
VSVLIPSLRAAFLTHNIVSSGGFGIEPVNFMLSITPASTSLGVFAIETVNSSATLQLLVTPVDFF